MNDLFERATRQKLRFETTAEILVLKMFGSKFDRPSGKVTNDLA